MCHIMDVRNGGESSPFLHVTAVIANGIDDRAQLLLECLENLRHDFARPVGSRDFAQRGQILKAQGTLKINLLMADAQNHKEFFRTKLNTMIQKDNPIIPVRFLLGEQIVAEFLHPKQNRIRSRCLKWSADISADNLTAFGNGAETGRGL